MNPAPETPPAERLRVADAGKRLLALIVDVFFFILLLRTVEQLLRPEHWDLLPPGDPVEEAMALYVPLLVLLLLRDAWRGRGPGKMLLGLTVRETSRLNKSISPWLTLQRNLLLPLLPVEGAFLIWDIYFRKGYGQRLGDRWTRTVVIEQPRPMGGLRRLLLANIILFAFFALSWFYLDAALTRKTAAFQVAEEAIRQFPEIAKALAEHPELNEAELQLDLRPEEAEPSRVRVRVGPPGEEDVGVHVVTELELRRDPEPRWQVLHIQSPTPAAELER
jgi:GNAT superfamily N-acetyltransferase